MHYPPIDYSEFLSTAIFVYMAVTITILIIMICVIGIREMLKGYPRAIKVLLALLGLSLILAAFAYAELQGLIDVL